MVVEGTLAPVGAHIFYALDNLIKAVKYKAI